MAASLASSITDKAKRSARQGGVFEICSPMKVSHFPRKMRRPISPLPPAGPVGLVRLAFEHLQLLLPLSRQLVPILRYCLLLSSQVFRDGLDSLRHAVTLCA